MTTDDVKQEIMLVGLRPYTHYAVYVKALSFERDNEIQFVSDIKYVNTSNASMYII